VCWPSASLPQARPEIATIAARIAAEHADTNVGQGALVVSVKGEATRDVRPALLTLMGAVGFVLLIACANVANLLLARSAKRRGELAVRCALGATRSRLVRQFLTESILLSLLGGSLGVLLASFSADGLVRMFPPTISNLNIPRVQSIPIDLRVLGFALPVSLLTAALFGTVPVLAVRLSLHERLQETGRGSRGLRSGTYRSLLVTVGHVRDCPGTDAAGRVGRRLRVSRHLGPLAWSLASSSIRATIAVATGSC
jgi:putative ABC transport system permease protein